MTKKYRVRINKDNICERVKRSNKSPRKDQPRVYAGGNRWAEENARAVGNM